MKPRHRSPLCVPAALFFLVLSVATAEKQNTPSRAPKEFVLVEADAARARIDQSFEPRNVTLKK